jgi:glycosyltransferase involved in cell wall biosynthesis
VPTLDLTNGLSVVIPFYNEGDNTVKAAKAAEDALAKTKLPFEILVVDDGSTDGADKNDFPGCTIYIRKDHSGRVDTRLTGLN